MNDGLLRNRPKNSQNKKSAQTVAGNIIRANWYFGETGNTKLSLPVLVDLAAVLEVRVDDLLYDNSPMKRNAAIEAIIEMLDTCTTPQIKVIEDLVKAAKISLNQHF